MSDPGHSSESRGQRSVFIEDAAQLLGVSRRTVYNRIREGRLRTIRTRCGTQRVLLDSVEELLRAMRGGPAAVPSAEPEDIETEPLPVEMPTLP